MISIGIGDGAQNKSGKVTVTALPVANLDSKWAISLLPDELLH